MSFYRLVARDDALNIRREYVIYQSKSLYGDSLVNICYGREKSKGHHITMVFKDKETAGKYVQNALKKRLNSQKRIGCNYILKN